MINTSLVRDPVISAPECMVFQSLSFYVRKEFIGHSRLHELPRTGTLPLR